jgi:archaemetzincin
LLITSMRSLGDERKIAARAVEDILGLAVQEQETGQDPASQSINPARRQADAFKTVQSLSNSSSHDGLRLHITGVDLYFDGYNYCFGLAFKDAAIISVYRLRTIDRERYLARVRKEVIHEVGHLLGLSHCPSPRCVMFFSNTIIDTDMKGVEPCRGCRAKLTT